MKKILCVFFIVLIICVSPALAAADPILRSDCTTTIPRGVVYQVGYDLFAFSDAFSRFDGDEYQLTCVADGSFITLVASDVSFLPATAYETSGNELHRQLLISKDLGISNPDVIEKINVRGNVGYTSTSAYVDPALNNIDYLAKATTYLDKDSMMLYFVVLVYPKLYDNSSIVDGYYQILYNEPTPFIQDSSPSHNSAPSTGTSKSDIEYLAEYVDIMKEYYIAAEQADNGDYVGAMDTYGDALQRLYALGENS